MATHNLTVDEVRQEIVEAIRPGQFYARAGTTLTLLHRPEEETPWEVYKGRLLDASQTRLRRSFESWHLCRSAGPHEPSEPFLFIRLDPVEGKVHVVRAIYCYAWEGYHAGNNVYESREVCKWIPELVGTVALNSVVDGPDLAAEIRWLLLQAVVGSSRLPITSVEAPLPAFSLGDLAYFHRPSLDPTGDQPLRSYRELIDAVLPAVWSEAEASSLIEFLLRSVSTEEIPEVTALFSQQWTGLGAASDRLAAVFRKLFNEVALSPYTAFVDHLLLFLEALVGTHCLSRERHVDLLSYFLRQTGRHLTAYDLVTFHHRGANYPDALLLDAVLRNYLRLIECEPSLFAGESTQARIHRRALRQGWLMWHLLRGLPVPDAPTSPGENARVLPLPYERVPEEQILAPGKRTKRLFAGQSLDSSLPEVAEVLHQSIADLQAPQELQELGMAIFLDRPLSRGKAPGEPDRTLLFSYEAFSRSIAQKRLAYLHDTLGLVEGEFLSTLQEGVSSLPSPAGIVVPPGPRQERPGSISLADTAKVAEDFLLLKTTGQTVQRFLEQFELRELGDRWNSDPAQHPWLIVADPGKRTEVGLVLTVYDAALRPLADLLVDLTQGYQLRRGHEYPRAGIRVLRTGEENR